MWQTGFSFSHLQKPDPEALEEIILTWYTEIYALFARDRHLIPPGAFCEVKYEELVRHPLDTLKNVYTTLGLPGFEEFQAVVKPYLEAQKSYKRNKYVLMATKENCVSSGDRCAPILCPDLVAYPRIVLVFYLPKIMFVFRCAREKLNDVSQSEFWGMVISVPKINVWRFMP
jgi:hypothetical protein